MRHARRRGLVAFAMTALLLALPGCGNGSASPTPPLRIFASASLAAAFEEMADAWRKEEPGTVVELQVAGAPQLVLQLRSGAEADLFASADMVNMRRVVDAGLAADAPVLFAKNRLAIVHAAGNPKSISSPTDLGRADLKVALCAPEVPAGRYAREALARAGVVAHSVSDESSVRALVMKVKEGELDAGIVYATDLRTPGIEGTPIDGPEMPIADYPVVSLRSGKNPAAAARFRTFLLGPKGRAVLASHGFGVP